MGALLKPLGMLALLKVPAWPAMATDIYQWNANKEGNWPVSSAGNSTGG